MDEIRAVGAEQSHSASLYFLWSTAVIAARTLTLSVLDALASATSGLAVHEVLAELDGSASGLWKNRTIAKLHLNLACYIKKKRGQKVHPKSVQPKMTYSLTNVTLRAREALMTFTAVVDVVDWTAFPVATHVTVAWVLFLSPRAAGYDLELADGVVVEIYQAVVDVDLSNTTWGNDIREILVS